MAYTDHIDDMNIVRNYVRQFFVGGFKEFSDYAYLNKKDKFPNKKSKRDFEYIQSKVNNCLGQSMKFEYAGKENKGKVLLSTDNSELTANPFYNLFKTKAFTDNDIVLRFLILDYIKDEKNHKNTQADIKNNVESFHLDFSIDTVKNKLKELTDFGLVTVSDNKYRVVEYSEEQLDEINKLTNAIMFFSEADPLGVIGYFTTEMLRTCPDLFRFRQKYIFRAIDSEILYELISAINRKKPVKIEVINPSQNATDNGNVSLETETRIVYPYKIYISSQSGRQHLFYFEHTSKTPCFVRLDHIYRVEILPEVSDFDFEKEYNKFKDNAWGVSSKIGGKTERIEFSVRIEENEEHILQRLQKEKRCGKVEKVKGSDNLWRFSADIYDSLETLVWIRTFIGRIQSFSCENEMVKNRFACDFNELCKAYGMEYTAEVKPNPQIISKITPEKISDVTPDANPEKKPRMKTMLFHKIYSKYYYAAARVLTKTHNNLLTQTEIEGIIEDNAFEKTHESDEFLGFRSDKCIWKSLLIKNEDRKYTSVLNYIPKKPLTLLEKQWLKSMLSSPEIKLFFPDRKNLEGISALLKDVEPLYIGNPFVYFDRRQSTAPFESSDYQKVFATVIKAITDKKALSIQLKNSAPALTCVVKNLEYSEMDNSFAVLVIAHNQLRSINLEEIKACQITEEIPNVDIVLSKTPKEEITLKLTDKYNALDRVMLSFSDLEKKTEKEGDNTYKLTLRYKIEDEADVINRILSFGSSLIVTGNEQKVKLIKDKINAQKSIFSILPQ